VFVLIFGVFLLDEGFTLNKAIGTLFIFVSLYFFYKK
jgi:drug/metabolite transporter (DMT)-like permease